MPPPRPDPSSRRPKRTPTQRAQAVKDAVAARGPGRIVIHTPDGTVTVDDVTVTGAVVEVTAPDYADPHFRIINPPRYVPDPDGDVEFLVGDQIHRFREDPLAALGHAIVQHGGQMKDPRRGRAQ